jgi:dTDP-4-dehydrorhamnose reductase
MKKILILGASGMAGHMVYYYLSSLNKYEILTGCYRNKVVEESIVLDVYDTERMRRILEETTPDYIVNCIGILIRGSCSSSKNAIYVNAYFPHFLTDIMGSIVPSSQLIHISTDCVFSGVKGAYSDTDLKDALDVYGMTKNLGEVINEKHCTIRTSIIGPELKSEGEGLFHWVFGQRQRGILDGYEKSLWGGVTTLELAKAIDQCIDHEITGLYQLSNGISISKHELIKMIINRFHLTVVVQKVAGAMIDKSIQSSYRDGFEYTVPSYEIMIDELYWFMTERKDIYRQYWA